ncbi:MAG: O-antigen ligase family protein [Verrucomicrobiota bacterium]
MPPSDDMDSPDHDPDTRAPRRRRRRKSASEGQGHGTAEGHAAAPAKDLPSVTAFGGMALLGISAMLLSGAPLALMLAVVWVGFGCLLIWAPPRFAVRRLWLVSGVALLAGCSLAFLPWRWFGEAPWRAGLEALGQSTGTAVSIRPAMTAGLLAQLAVSMLAAWYLLGHRIPDKHHRWLVMAIAAGIAVYGVVCMLAFRVEPAWKWDPVVTFGIYSNRNHTATVLVMGALCSLGLIMEGIRTRNGAVAGLSSLFMAVCGFGLLGFSVSRAGVLFLFAGSVAWFLGLGSGFLTRRLVITVVGLMVVIGGIFWIGNTGVRERIESQLSRLQTSSQPEVSDDSDDAAATTDDQPFDFRVLIYRDTWAMLRDEPVTGVGLGQFGTLFPQYRSHSIIKARCVHPESSWLLLATEAGWMTVVVAAGAVGALFFTAFRQGRRHRGWPLTLATLLAALVVPLHGFFDVPAYHVGITWTALLLIALSFREEAGVDREAGTLTRRLFQAAGVAVIAGGLWWGASWMGVPGTAPATVGPVIAEVKALYARDAAEKRDPANNPPETAPDGGAVDQLEAAQEVLKPALNIEPMDPELHYLRGLLSVNFSDEEAIADQAFAVERLLMPDRVEVPFRQGLAWMEIDPARTLKLWEEALRRSIAADSLRPGAYWSPPTLIKKAAEAAKGRPALDPVIQRLAAQVPAAPPPASK